MERPSAPTVSNDGARATPPVRPIRPKAGFSPATPQKQAGMRIDPPVSLPTATGTIPAATAAPEPPLEPPGTRSRFHGFLAPPRAWCWVVMPHPNSCDRVVPTITAPARRRRRTHSASASAVRPASTSDP